MNLAEELCTYSRKLGEKGFGIATSGNYSARLSDSSFLVSMSGVDKTNPEPDQFMPMGFDRLPIEEHDKRTPSYEMPLHGMIYHAMPEITWVFHVHSVANTVVSMNCKQNHLEFCGYEGQNYIYPSASSREPFHVPIFENDENRVRLANQIQEQLKPTCRGFLLRGHGLFAMGQSASQALKHLEAYEFLFRCRLAELQM